MTNKDIIINDDVIENKKSVDIPFGKIVLSLGGMVAAVVCGWYASNNIVTVQAGYVGVRVNLYADKGVQNETVGTASARRVPSAPVRRAGIYRARPRLYRPSWG